MSVRIASSAEPIPGYRLIERLGRGGFGEVWKAEAPGGLLKAIKFVFGDLEGSGPGEDSKPAEQEYKALARVKSIRHPYILSLERFDVIDGQLLIVMELADKNLWDRFRECRAEGLPGIAREELLRYMDETSEALDLMNSEHQLQHLDIKPQNLFLVYNHIKVADFGLVKDLEGMKASVTGGVTPVYAAPETFEGWVSRYCDQYSLAIVFQELLTGQRPFNGNNTRQLLMQHLQGVPDLSSLPTADRDIIGRALAKKPDDRWPTCTEMARQLRRAGSATVAANIASPINPPSTAMLGPPPSTSGRQPTAPQPPAAGSPPPRIQLPPLTGAGPSTPFNDAPGGVPPLTQLRPAVFQTATIAALAGARAAVPEMTGDGVLRPAVVLAVGRLGLSVLRQFRRSLLDRIGPFEDLAALRMLYLDTDLEEIQRIASEPDPARALTAREVAVARLNRPSHYMRANDSRFEKWLPPQTLYRIPRQPETGGVRAFGRLALVDHCKLIVNRLRAELDAVIEPGQLGESAKRTGLGIATNRPRCYVVTSLTGGTGSGMFLDLAYLLRHQLRQLGYDQPDVVGLFLVPQVDRNTPKSQAIGNAHAALMELAHFSSPNTVYEARFDTKDLPVVDADRPFRRCTLLPLPKNADAWANRRAAALAGEVLYRELCTPLGRIAEERRNEYAASFHHPGASCQTLGVYRMSWPREPLLRRTAHRLAASMLDQWHSKEASHLREPIRQWLEQQWQHRQLDPEVVIGRLQGVVQEALQQMPEQLIDAAVHSLTGGNAAPSRLDPTATCVVLEKLLQLVGKPDEEVIDPIVGSIRPFLEREARAIVAENETQLAEIACHFIEQPMYRLAGADEVLRQFQERVQQVVATFEELHQQNVYEANVKFARLFPLIGGLKSSFFRGPKANPVEVIDLLRDYPRKRLVALLAGAVLTVYRSLIGSVPEYVREVNFARLRLAELLQSVANEVPVGVENLPAVPGQYLLPPGCKSLSDAANHVVSNLPAEDLNRFDTALQGQIRKQFKGLAQVCLDTADASHTLKELILNQAEQFLKPTFERHDPAEVFFKQYPSEQDAQRELAQAFDEAMPELVGPRARPEAQVCILATPESEAGQRLHHTAVEAMSDLEIVPTVSPDAIFIYREHRHISLADLPITGPLGHDCMTQVAAAEQLSLHTRSDIHWQPLSRE